MNKNAFFITTPIYYVNAPCVHVGHGITTILADVRARFERLRGRDVFLSTGTDEHGSAVAKAAEKAGVTPQLFADQNATNFLATWKQFNISFDDFIRTTEQRHLQGVDTFLNALHASGYIYQGTYKGHYCTGCEAFKEPEDLVDGNCPIHKTKADYLEEKNWFFKLSALAPKVKALIENNTIRIMPEGRRNEVLGFLNGEVKDVSISRETVSWGIPLPFDEKQTTYVWIEALLNYITVIGFDRNMEHYKRYWEQAERVHTLGKDIIRFHCVIWPAMLLAVGFPLPHTLFVHAFLKSEGHKMSKSLGNVVYPDELAAKFGVDGARYVLFAETPVNDDGDIKQSSLGERYNAELKNNLGNLFSRLTVLAQKAKIVELRPDTQSKESKAFAKLVSTAWKNASSAIEQFDTRAYLAVAQQPLEAANKYIDTTKPWQIKESGELAPVLATAFELLRHGALLLSPIIPATFDTIGQSLHLQHSLPFAKKITWGAQPIAIPTNHIHLFHGVNTKK